MQLQISWSCGLDESGCPSFQALIQGDQPTSESQCQSNVLCVIGLRPPETIRDFPGRNRAFESADGYRRRHKVRERNPSVARLEVVSPEQLV
jgi:hypothetical protein